ncbi:MAG: hypothetical protein JWR68_851 [Polaromonas sp.]|nr:hypothetical protein [Polaromonas sp.]
MTHNDCLFHYCSTASFHAIVESNSIRLSSLSLSNDSMEGKLVGQTIGKSIAPGQGGPNDLLRQVVEMEKGNDALGFCLSQWDDRLSQWRGYADDGAGLCIGFSKPYLKKLTAELKPDGFGDLRLEEIDYDPASHERLVKPAIDQFAKVLGAEGVNNYARLRDHERARIGPVMDLSQKLFLLKSEAFKEEGEWRLLSTFNPQLPFKGKFHPKGNRLVPFMEIKLKIDEHVIEQIVLGPKHVTPENVVKRFLETSGFPNVKVSRSAATYR